MDSLLLTLVVCLKFILPSTMLWIPVLGLWGNYILDVVDGDILLSLGMAEHTYQTTDKFADLVAYIFMFILGCRWKIRKTITILFIYRLVGQLLFFAIGDERIFFVFQNFLEPLMLIYVLIILKHKSEEKAYKVYKKYIWLWWSIILAYKIWEEWRIHVANFDLSLLLFGFTGGM